MERVTILDTCVAIGRKEGLITAITAIEYPTAVRFDFDILWPDNEDLQKAIELAASLYAIGKPVPASDLIIASMAIRRELDLLTMDKHFGYIKEVAPELSLTVISKPKSELARV